MHPPPPSTGSSARLAQKLAEPRYAETSEKRKREGLRDMAQGYEHVKQLALKIFGNASTQKCPLDEVPSVIFKSSCTEFYCCRQRRW